MMALITTLSSASTLTWTRNERDLMMLMWWEVLNALRRKPTSAGDPTSNLERGRDAHSHPTPHIIRRQKPCEHRRFE